MKVKKFEIVFLLVLVLALCIWALWPKETGNTVIVTVDGEEVLTLNLSEKGKYPLTGYNGFSLTVILEEGSVRVEDSTCPDLICQNHAPISHAGEQIVCLPARIVVTVESDEEADVDAVVG